MLDRVAMNVIHVTTQSDVVTDQMLPIAALPETALPHTAFAAGDPPIAAPLLSHGFERETKVKAQPITG
jgi:hypothetical protein